MNCISTDTEHWVEMCEQWAAANTPFEVRDAKSIQEGFFKYLCEKYPLRQIRSGSLLLFFPIENKV